MDNPLKASAMITNLIDPKTVKRGQVINLVVSEISGNEVILQFVPSPEFLTEAQITDADGTTLRLAMTQAADPTPEQDGSAKTEPKSELVPKAHKGTADGGDTK